MIFLIKIARYPKLSIYYCNISLTSNRPCVRVENNELSLFYFFSFLLFSFIFLLAKGEEDKNITQSHKSHAHMT